MSGQVGISVREFARIHGLSERQLLYYCRLGRVIGASKHPLTKKWTIFPPAKLVLSSFRPKSYVA